MTAEEVIKQLRLEPLPEEGGFYRETYRSAENWHMKDSDQSRALSTAIYFLVTPETWSAFHRLTSDEIFHFYLGDPVEMMQIDKSGKSTIHILGQDLEAGMKPQITVPMGNWQSSKLLEGGSWALLGTTVSPGFDFEDIEFPDSDEFDAWKKQWPDLMQRFSR
jgi:predicted cupin superfamily sugar epimerase